jgi:CBS domain-containing protein
VSLDRRKIMNELLRISCCMKRNVIVVRADTTLREAAALIIEKRIGTLPVVDEVGTLDGVVIEIRIGTLPVVDEVGTLDGVVHIRDIIQIFLPDFVSLLSNIDFVKDFGAKRSPATGALREAEVLTVEDIMEKPVAVEEDSSLIRALSLMESHNLSDLLVVNEGKLVVLASRADIGRAFLADWISSRHGKQ